MFVVHSNWAFGRSACQLRIKSTGTSKTMCFEIKDDAYKGGYGGVDWVATGAIIRDGDKIRRKSTGTSQTMCFEKMMHTGADMGKWIG